MLTGVTLALGLLAAAADPAWHHHAPSMPGESCVMDCSGACGPSCGTGCNADANYPGHPNCVKDFLFGHHNMHPHYPYYPEAHGYYYFRPYHHAHIARHQAFVTSWGGDPRAPYDNRVFENIYSGITFEATPGAIPVVPLGEPEPSFSDEPPTPPAGAPHLEPPAPRFNRLPATGSADERSASSRRAGRGAARYVAQEIR